VHIKNNYIHTTTCNVSKSNEAYQTPIFEHSKTCLISLIHALSSGSFGIDTVNKGCHEIQKYKQKYLNEVYPFILDSGGYSIIAGDVKYVDISKFIDGYLQGLELLKDDIDYVFSLDIPIFINDNDKNTINTIGMLNEYSLESSIKLLEKFPELIPKFSMVLQWKMPGQYYIWDTLYDNLGLKNYIKNYAVGGLVGLLGICPHIDFAPFIGPCYYWLYRYMEAGNYTRPLFIHILGQYHKSARFILFFLQELFTDYLKVVNQTCVITFDTVNYSLSSMYKARVGIDIYQNPENDTLRVIHSHELTEEILFKIYTTPESLELFYNNWNNSKGDDLLTDTSFLIPAYIYSQVELDKYFHYIIKSKELIRRFRRRDNLNENNKFKTVEVIRQLSPYLNFLTSNFKKSIQSSLSIIYSFHNNAINGFNKKVLDEQMKDFIVNYVKFPFDLN